MVKFRLNRWFWLGLSVSVSCGGAAIALSWLWFDFDQGLSSTVATLADYARPNTLTITADDGSLLQEEGPITHEKVEIEAVPPHVIQAFIASEDHRFEEHQGVDIPGIMRAAWVNFRAGDIVEGGSTITQQLARMVFLSQEVSFQRKFKEVRLAQQIEAAFTKAEILEHYFNLVYLGSGAYGLADAAWVYFGKPVADVTLPEAAMLAGIVPAPSVYSPLVDKVAATRRRNLVLQRMQTEGLIESSTAAEAIATPLQTQQHPPKRLERQAFYFTDYIQQEIDKYVTPEQLAAGGLVVETTLDPRWQQVGDATIAETVANYGQWRGFSQAALVALDPRTGAIKAMVGGKDFDENQFNRVTQAQRQPGSTFKTFVYTTAIAAGFPPHKQYLDTKFSINGYEPRNYREKYRNGYVSINTALTASINVVALRTLLDLGWQPVIQMAQAMGIESKLQPTYSLALGASEVNLLELTNAYGTLANHGVRRQAYGIRRILDRHGKTLYQAKFAPIPALDPETNAIVTSMLEQVVTAGTGRAAQIGRPVAGKTGTTDEARDLWFIGFIPQVVTGVWLGNDDFSSTYATSGLAAQTWRQFMLKVVADLPIESFPAPPKKLEGRKPQIELKPLKPQKTRETVETVTAQRSPTRRSRRIVRRSPRPSQPTAPSPAEKPVATTTSPTPRPPSTPNLNIRTPSTETLPDVNLPSPETQQSQPVPSETVTTPSAQPTTTSPVNSPPTNAPEAFPTPQPASIAPSQSVPAPAAFPAPQAPQPVLEAPSTDNSAPRKIEAGKRE